VCVYLRFRCTTKCGLQYQQGACGNHIKAFLLWLHIFCSWDLRLHSRSIQSIQISSSLSENYCAICKCSGSCCCGNDCFNNHPILISANTVLRDAKCVSLDFYQHVLTDVMLSRASSLLSMIMSDLCDSNLW
jgi:hypothetical protein